MEKLSSAVATLTSGKLPEDRNTVGDCMLHVSSHLLQLVTDEYLSGKSPLAVELRHLVKNLRNAKDPWVKDLGVLERAMLQNFLTTLNHAKRRSDADQAESHPAENAASR
jgi:hypothetical protein